MGKRKQDSALARKAANMDVVKASLNDCPSSPRKMRLVADIIRGEQVDKALYILKYSKKEASNKLEKLLLSAIANWQVKNEGQDIEEANLFVKEIFVDSARQLKRLRPVPQGRGYRIRKRSNHVTLILGNKTDNQ
ncbi:50S ribosomal protein L22 [Elizabethkingia miricola]|uniref:50S ribosomal protein L22 n=1 Tax=Elizabethkingia miricola TaxID=172045 RepID=UPI00099A0542|nr:50S ribosomal protein L22 [Elizabethkingia miricola]OPC40734.1 50S ribosomal protein L22 [Elizabethkingia miricola]